MRLVAHRRGAASRQASGPGDTFPPRASKSLRTSPWADVVFEEEASDSDVSFRSMPSASVADTTWVGPSKRVRPMVIRSAACSTERKVVTLRVIARERVRTVGVLSPSSPGPQSLCFGPQPYPAVGGLQAPKQEQKLGPSVAARRQPALRRRVTGGATPPGSRARRSRL
jgi:hypothetical protein